MLEACRQRTGENFTKTRAEGPGPEGHAWIPHRESPFVFELGLRVKIRVFFVYVAPFDQTPV